MEFEELLAPVSGEPDIAEAFASWDWLIPIGARAILATALGDVFLTAADGTVYFLDVVSGRCDRVAESSERWEGMLHDPHFVEQHFTPGFIALLRERRGVLARGECYVPEHPPVLGGSWEAENWSPGNWVSHLERQGRVHSAIKDLPDGTIITKLNFTEI